MNARLLLFLGGIASDSASVSASIIATSPFSAKGTKPYDVTFGPLVYCPAGLVEPVVCRAVSSGVSVQKGRASETSLRSSHSCQRATCSG